MGSRKKITKDTRKRLYGAVRYLNAGAKEELGMKIPFDVYVQDPLVAEEHPMYGFDSNLVRWEPGLADGPTSARFSVVDYNNDTDYLAPLAKWDAESESFTDDALWVLDRNNKDCLQFDQVHVWAVLQRALEFFEGGTGLGRPIPYGFEGNRLIIVPHAGYGKNAFYDRESKSLQFYYFNDENGKRVNTCLSTDIINHEFGHAVLDGIRPHLYESSLVETGAFHEFIGDLSAILLLLRNNAFRGIIADETGGNLSRSDRLSHIAKQFGSAVSDKPYLRTARNSTTMNDVSDNSGPHKMSEVLTGAMFDILMEFSDRYIKSGRTAQQAFWHAIDRMQRVAIQPLDLLPPCDVTFRDYALAVIHAEEISNPADPHGYCKMMLKIFQKRKIISQSDVRYHDKAGYLLGRVRVDVKHSIEDISRSRAAAYSYLNDNRENLLIPPDLDLIVADLYDANKVTRQGLRLPRQIILEYVWREEVELKGTQFCEFENEHTTMLCGGTLVFDENGNVLSWFRKPGTESGRTKSWQDERKEGVKRLEKLLEDLAARIQSGHVGSILGSGKGILGTQVPPLVVKKQDGILRFNLSPHMHVAGEDHEHYEGGPQWEVSS